MQVVESIDLITRDPSVRGGRPCLTGTEVRVTDIVMAHLFHERTPADLSADYELTLAQVYAALAYYYQHKPELDEDIRRQVHAARRAKDAQTFVIIPDERVGSTR